MPRAEGFGEYEPRGTGALLGHARAAGELALLELADEGDVDVGQDTSTSDGGLDELIEFIVGTDGEKQVARVDTLDVHVLGSIAGQLEQLGSQVLQDGSAVDGSGGSDTASSVGALLQETVDTTDRELRGSQNRCAKSRREHRERERVFGRPQRTPELIINRDGAKKWL